MQHRFDAFICLKHWEDFIDKEFFWFSFHTRTLTFDQANKKMRTIHVLHVHPTITCILTLSLLSW